jgi:hypothetical protein
MNKYEKWYQDICDRGFSKRTDEYTERHHIIPESFYKNRTRKGKPGWLLGNPDDPSNITWLTAKEHAIAHHLLTKVYKHDKRAYPKVIKALEMMGTINHNQTGKRYKLIPRVYALAREERAKIQSEEMKGEGNPNFGNHWTDEQKEEQSKKITGRKQTPEALANLREALDKRKELGVKRKGYSDEYKEERSKKYSGEGNPNFGKVHKDETLKKMSIKATGRKQSEETIKKKADAIRGSKREKVHCDWCNKDVAVNGYARFHGPNCHMNPDSPRYDPDKKPR